MDEIEFKLNITLNTFFKSVVPLDKQALLLTNKEN